MLRFPQSMVTQAGSSAVLPITGAAPITVTGTAIDGGLASIMIGALVSITITTNTVTAYAKWQVNVAGTWTDVIDSNNPANVVLVTGTGTIQTVTKLISAPLAVVAGSRQARCVVYTLVGTGAGGTADTATISYDFRSPTSTYGA